MIPAHNEAQVISRLLSGVEALAAERLIEVIVVCNGCSDDTATIAKSFSGVVVVELSEPSKTGALNYGDSVAQYWPRAYVDADIVATGDTMVSLFEALSESTAQILAARPSAVVDTSLSSALVQRYYRARANIWDAGVHLWGAGIYAVTESGHKRIGRFPDVVADDLWTDNLFATHEKTVVDGAPVTVFAPRHLRALVRVAVRVRRGNMAIDGRKPPTSSALLIIRSIKNPSSAVNAAVFLLVNGYSRVSARLRRSAQWSRDESARSLP